MLHRNQQFHIILNCLIKVVKQNERISTFQQLSKSIHYRNNFEIFKISSLQKLVVSFRKIQFFTVFATFQCDFEHNFMRTRSIFDIFDYLNRIHFVLRYEFFIVNFIYWMQMLLKCEICEIAEQWRNVELFRNFIRCNFNFEVVSKRIFFKKISNLFVR